MRVPEHWHRLLRELVESLTLEIFRSHWTWSCLWVALLDQMTFQRSLPTSAIL